MPWLWQRWLVVMVVLLAMLRVVVAVAATDLVLTTGSDLGFRRLIQMAQQGELGEAVHNANISIDKKRVRVELLGDGPAKNLWLSHKSTPQDLSRYFHVEPGDGATVDDVHRLSVALDAVFTQDPFGVSIDAVGSSLGGPAPSWGEVWAGGGLLGMVKELERRLTSLASLSYTVALIVVLAGGLAVSLVVLSTARIRSAGEIERDLR